MSNYIAPDTTTNEWNAIPFEVNGVQFISKVRKGSDFDMRLKFIPQEVFKQMNIDAIRDCVGNPSLMTRSDLIAELERVNHGGKNAILELA